LGFGKIELSLRIELNSVNIMASITLKYNSRNSKAKNLLNYVLTTGLLTPIVENKSSLATALEDLEKGRIYHSVRKSKV